MSMVAQLAHAPPMIDLGRPDSMLHLFYCANLLCPSYGAADGCRAMILPCGELEAGLTLQPPDKEGGQSVNGEFWIVGWEQHDDGVPPDQAPLFYDDRSHMNLPDELAQPFGFDGRWDTKAAGVPYWTGNGVTLDHARIPCPPFTFLLQINQRVYVDGPPPSADQAGLPVSIYSETGGETQWQYVEPSDRSSGSSHASLIYQNGDEFYGADFVNFGSDGTGFVFIDRSADPPEVRWYWSR